MGVPQVVIVGRPNVGKSSIFNWLVGQRIAIIDATAGVTRDRVTHPVELDDRYVELSKAGMYDVGRRVTSRDFRSCHTFDVRDRLDEIAAPTLAVVGEHDRLTPPSYHEYLAENVQDGRYAEIADAAHLAMLERPEAFNDALTDFFDDAR